MRRAVLRTPIILAALIAILSAAWVERAPLNELRHGLLDPPVAPVFDSAPEVLGSGSSGTRIYLFHGLRDSKAVWHTEPYKGFLDARLSRGDQVVIPTLPYAQASFFKSDGGADYCRRFAGWFSALDRNLDRAWRPRRKLSVGASYGGLHAMIAAGSSGVIERYAAFSPVTSISALDEFWWTDNARCNQGDYATALRATPGIITYGTADDRVGAARIAALVNEVAAKSITYPGRGHEMKGDELAAIDGWLK